MTPQEGSSLLKSCARRSFSFTRGNLQAFATHPHSLGDPLLGRDYGFRNTDLTLTRPWQPQLLSVARSLAS